MNSEKFGYYIRVNDNNHIVKTFSSALEEPLQTDILVNEGEGIQFVIGSKVLSAELKQYANEENGLVLFDEVKGVCLLKYEDGLISQISEADEYFISLARTSKYIELTKKCNESILSGFETIEGKFYQFAEKDQTNFTQQTMVLILDSSITTVKWESGDQDGKFVEYTKEEFLQLIGLAQLHKNTNISKLTTLRNKLDSASTVEEIKLIEW